MGPENLFVDDGTQLGINPSPPRALCCENIFNFLGEVVGVVLPNKPEFVVRRPSVIVAAIKCVNGKRDIDITSKERRLILQDILGTT